MEHLIRALDTRGLFDCPRVITDAEAVEAGRSMYLRPKSTSVTPFFPGPMQLRHEIPQGSDNLIVRFRLSPEAPRRGTRSRAPSARSR